MLPEFDALAPDPEALHWEWSLSWEINCKFSTEGFFPPMLNCCLNCCWWLSSTEINLWSGYGISGFPLGFLSFSSSITEVLIDSLLPKAVPALLALNFARRLFSPEGFRSIFVKGWPAAGKPYRPIILGLITGWSCAYEAGIWGFIAFWLG